jgi:hypothetical protein
MSSTIESKRRAVRIDSIGPDQEQCTSAYITDHLLIDLCEKEQTLSADIVKEISGEIFDSSRGISVLKYPAEFLRTAYRISVSNFTSFPLFRIDPRDLSPRVLNEILAMDMKTQNLIIMDVITRILRSNDKLLYLEYIQPNRKRLSWKWEEFDFDGRIAIASENDLLPKNREEKSEVMTA